MSQQEKKDKLFHLENAEAMLALMIAVAKQQENVSEEEIKEKEFELQSIRSEIEALKAELGIL